MGLDMYMNIKVSHYPHKGNTTIDLNNLNGSWDTLEFGEFGESNRIDISMGVGYWRKANHIHRWFVENIQKGNDDCGDYDVYVEDVEELYTKCMDILKRLHGKKFTITDEHRDFVMKYAEERGVEVEDTVTFDIEKMEKFYKDSNLRMYNREMETDEEFEEFCNDILPTQNGCFFGSTTVSWWYFDDIIKTVLIIDKMRRLAEEYDKKNVRVYFSYSASW